MRLVVQREVAQRMEAFTLCYIKFEGHLHFPAQGSNEYMFHPLHVVLHSTLCTVCLINTINIKGVHFSHLQTLWNCNTCGSDQL